MLYGPAVSFPSRGSHKRGDSGVCGRGIRTKRCPVGAGHDSLVVMPDLIGHLNIGQHQRRYLRVCVLSMRSTVMMDRMGGLVHENRDFCERENKIEASVHENRRSVDRPRLK